ncbi:MAG: hypothetical protein JWM73_1935 [Solirubrobacterales bacterium]|nr:hypothetical protein [Solirubrobacterales bacterium]
MRRFSAVAAAFTALALIPASAGAKVIEIGATPTQAVPSCPTSPCFAVNRTTGYQAKVGTDRGLMTVPANGRIVAWTIGLSKPNAAQIKYFTTKLGGPAQAGITVLKVGKYLNDTVKAQGPLVSLAPYFGSFAQFPLATAIPVLKGDLIALTVPTWAPALQVGLGGDTSWRASRGKNKCKDDPKLTPPPQTAQLNVGDKQQYFCLYRTARLVYTATLITYPKKTVKTPSKKSARDSR